MKIAVSVVVEAFWLFARLFCVVAFGVGISLCAPLASAQGSEALEKTLTLEIAPNTRLEDALIEWGTKAGMTVMVNTVTVAHKTTRGVQGTMRADVALTSLLVGSGLSYTAQGGRVQIVPSNTLIRSGLRSGQPNDGVVIETESDGAGGSGGSGGSLNAVGSSDSESGGSRQRSLEEVTVTAQKRTENLLEVPVPVTAINANVLVAQNEVRMQDWFSEFPGLNLSAGNRGEIFPSIRGIGFGNYGTNPTVGITVDDIPYGGSTGPATAPDIDPSDLDHIEVLRGPQGTLYGADSLGGLIKYVTVDPTTKGVSGRLEAGTTSVYNGAELGYSVRGAINVPVSDTIAIRVSGYTRQNPGYIDNPVLQQDGVNKGRDSGGHLSAMWSPTESLSLKLSALIQHSSTDGSADVFTNVPGFSVSRLQQDYLPGSSGYNRWDEVFGATLKAKVGPIDLTSLTAYSYGRYQAKLDLSTAFTGFVQPIFGPDSGAILHDSSLLNKFSEEVRLSSSVGNVEWLLGGFFSHETSHGSPAYSYPVVDTVSLAQIGYFGTLSGSATVYQEIAVFADLTLNFTDQFDVEFGGRVSHDRLDSIVSDYSGDIATAFFGSDPYSYASEGATANPFTYLITPQFKFSRDLMIYARISTGFRPGFGNSPIAALAGLPPSVGPDKTQNYEVGVKGETWNDQLSFDLSVYRINWKGIQLSIVDPRTSEPFNTNGGGAKSQGIEFSTELKPLEGLTIGGWVTISDASLRQGLPVTSGLYGESGDPLPYASRFSGNLSVQQAFPIVGDWSGYVGGKLSYVGEREGSFQATSTRAIFPAYAETDIRAGAKYQLWDVGLLVANVTDKRGAVGGGIDNAIFPNSFLYIQPRTIGLTVSKAF